MKRICLEHNAVHSQIQLIWNTLLSVTDINVAISFYLEVEISLSWANQTFAKTMTSSSLTFQSGSLSLSPVFMKQKLKTQGNAPNKCWTIL